MLLSANTGAPLMEPHMLGGSMIPAHGGSMPISSYIETALDPQFCKADNRKMTRLVTVCENNTAPHWCEGGAAVCVLDWTARCPGPIKYRRAVGHQVRRLPAQRPKHR
eukprot:1032721-Prymnesium_polylepis.2